MNTGILLAGLVAGAISLDVIELPDGSGGIGFDDLRFSPALHRVLVPAGRSGRLDLVDPDTRAVEGIAGFSSSGPGARGHSEGTTSVDAGEGVLFATDRTRRTLVVIDAATRRFVAQAKLGGGPDYVRWVAPLGEVWVTEPGEKAIETFRFAHGPKPTLTHAGTIPVPDGPESLEIDVTRRRAYANTWHDSTIALDLDRRTVVARWENGCKGARGLALDPKRGFAFVGCEEGAAVALDVVHGGKVVGRVPAGRGVDVIAFSSTLSHLYVPGADAATVTVAGVGGTGSLEVLGARATAPGAHCVTCDDAGRAYVCDPERGRILVLEDPFPASR